MGLPTLFLTLASEDLRWSELLSMISKLESNVFSEDKTQNWSYQDRCKLLDNSSILVVRHFQF